jgi:ribosome-associated translation inhibitor RaiA
MQVQVHTDGHIDGGEAFTGHVQQVVEHALSHYSEHITRVEVHLSDENGDKGGEEDKRCMMEARLEGRQPTAVTQHSATVNEAIDGAAGKLVRSIESTIGRRNDDRDRNN